MKPLRVIKRSHMNILTYLDPQPISFHSFYNPSTGRNLLLILYKDERLQIASHIYLIPTLAIRLSCCHPCLPFPATNLQVFFRDSVVPPIQYLSHAYSCPLLYFITFSTRRYVLLAYSPSPTSRGDMSYLPTLPPLQQGRHVLLAYSPSPTQVGHISPAGRGGRVGAGEICPTCLPSLPYQQGRYVLLVYPPSPTSRGDMSYLSTLPPLPAGEICPTCLPSLPYQQGDMSYLSTLPPLPAGEICPTYLLYYFAFLST